jgi:Na+-driven multidrug efflux pump
VTIIRKVLEAYRDPEYFVEIRKIAVPIIIQQLMFASLNMIGVVFVGQKGEISVAAVGFAGQIAFLLNLVHFGIISGAAMFTAQFWGRRDIPNLRRVLSLCLMLTISAACLLLLSQFLHTILHISQDAVIELGVDYIAPFMDIHLWRLRSATHLVLRSAAA